MENDFTAANTAEMKSEQHNILRFLVTNGFTRGSLGTLRSVALLIAKCACNVLADLKSEYALLATRGERPQSVRAKLIYCIKQNHADLRNGLLPPYRYDIGKFAGIKSFIDQIAFAYDLYAPH